MSRLNRRRVLQASGTALAAALAGCQDGSSNSTDEPGDTTASGTPTGTDGDTMGQNTADLEPVTVDEEWHMYQNGPRNTGFTENTVPSGDVERRWQFPIEAGAGAPRQPIVADGTLYLLDGGGVLRALNPSDGTEQWSADTVGPEVTPAYADGTLFVNGEYNNWEAYDAETGDRLWRETMLIGDTPMAVVDGLVYGALDGIVQAADPSTGTREWSTTLTESGLTSAAVAVADGRVITGVYGDGRSVVALDAASGEELWRYDAPGDPEDAVTIADGTVYVPTSDGTVCAVDAESGDEQWTAEPSNQLTGPVNYDGGTVYVHGNSLTAFDAASGEQQWQVDSDSSDGILASNGLLCTPSDQLAYHDRATGERQWAIEPPEFPVTIPVVANGLVFVGDEAGLTAYQAA